MSDFLYDKAVMALKAQRYDEATSCYEKILETGYNVDAWTGLGICKMFQIADGRTMEEVLYCFEKARNVEGADNTEIDLKLIQYSQVVIMQCAAFAIAAINNALEAERNAKTAAIISLASVAVAGLSNSTGVKVLAGAAAATSAGISIGQFGKMTSSKEIGKYATTLLENIYTNVYGFLIEKDKTKQAQALKETTEKLCKEIIETLDPSVKEERLMLEELDRLEKEQEENLNKLQKELTDENLLSLASSFADLGLLSVVNFDQVSDINVLGSINNDTVLFSLTSLSGQHYFCNNGVLSHAKTYYPYHSIKSLEKNWLGALKDKFSGYKIDLNVSGDWHKLVVDYINLKKQTSEPVSTPTPAPTSTEPADGSNNSNQEPSSAGASELSINNLAILPYTGEFKEIVEANCNEEDDFSNVLVDSSKAVIVLGEKGVVWYFKVFGSVNLKYFKYNDIGDLQKSWLGELKDKSSGFKIMLQSPDNWVDIITEFIRSKKT